MVASDRNGKILITLHFSVWKPGAEVNLQVKTHDSNVRGDEISGALLQDNHF